MARKKNPETNHGGGQLLAGALDVHKKEHDQGGLDGSDHKRDHRVEGTEVNKGCFHA